MATSEAHKRASNKYLKKMFDNGSLKQFKVTIKSEVYQLIDTYCKENEISKAQFLKNAAAEYISHHPTSSDNS